MGPAEAPEDGVMAPSLRVRMVAHDLGRGGAARATVRIADAIAARGPELGVGLSLRSVAGPPHPLGAGHSYPGGLARGVRYASSLRRRAADRLPWAPATSELHSRADVWTGLGRELSRSDLDVVNLHWLGTGTLSVEEIGRIRHPIVLSLHDMWAFTGAEHITYDERYVVGYPRGTRPAGEVGVDWNRRTWRRKVRAWRRPMHVVTPSRWLADCARRSALMHAWPIAVIPHALDSDFWRPVDRAAARAALGLPAQARLLLSGADGGVERAVKGGDLLWQALHHLARTEGTDAADSIPTEVVTFGGSDPHQQDPRRPPFRVHDLGRIQSDETLRAVYSACDVMIVPSRLEALGQTATEAQACATPVVTFDVAGLRDVLEDGVTGRRAEPFQAESLAAAIAWVVRDEPRRKALGAAARRSMVERFAPDVVARAYAEIFRVAHLAGRRSTAG